MQELTQDLFLGGRLKLHQPKVGYRAGSDTVLLSAAINAQKNHRVLDVGCGVGTVGICLAHRIEGTHVIGLECHPDLVALAKHNILENHLQDSMEVFQHDIQKGLLPQVPANSFDWVAANPPYYILSHHDQAHGHQRATSRAQLQGDLKLWVDFCFKMTRPRGHMVFIYPTERLEDLIIGLEAKKVGGLTLYPLWPKAGHPAKRILVQVRKGVASPTKVLPGLVLHEDHGTYTPQALKILKEGAGIDL